MQVNEDNNKQLEVVDGLEMKKMLAAAAMLLKEQQSLIDSLNVFPVPDGDTGTNMYLTFKEAVKSLEKVTNNHVGEVCSVVAKGALMGARGNSGVILSQLLRGFSQAIKKEKKLRVAGLASAFVKASEVAYHGVLKPVEGTILTVSREAGVGAKKAAANSSDIIYVLKETIRAASDSLSRTPEMLPALEEAEVVDAGGQGYLTILEGMLLGLTEENIEYSSEMRSVSSSAQKTATEDIKFVYCTQMLVKVKEKKLDYYIKQLRHDLQSYGDSLMVVGSDDIIKVHVHTNHPGVILESGLKIGTIHDINIDNMKEQSDAKRVKEEAERLPGHEHHQTEDQLKDSSEELIKVNKNTGIISVGNGEGIKKILSDLGVDWIIEGGQSMNPSTNDFVNAIEKLDVNRILILPNNKNILSSAQQAAEVSDKDIVVVPTRSITQAVTALMSFDDQADLSELKAIMEEEISYVTTFEITRAVKNSKVDGLEINEDDIIGIKNGKIEVAGSDYLSIIEILFSRHLSDEELVTIFYGADMQEEDAEKVKEMLMEKFELDEVEIYQGNQPLYPFIISME